MKKGIGMVEGIQAYSKQCREGIWRKGGAACLGGLNFGRKGKLTVAQSGLGSTFVLFF